MINRSRYAGFWVRFIASLFDTIILSIPICLFIVFIFDFDYRTSHYNFFEILITFVVTIIFWVYWNGQTPGKKLMKIKIVNIEDNGSVSSIQYMGRYFGYFISMLPFFLGFIMVAFREDKRGLHDLIAGTCVIYED